MSEISWKSRSGSDSTSSGTSQDSQPKSQGFMNILWNFG